MGRSMDETPSMGAKQRWDNYVTRWEWDEKGGYRMARLYGDVITEYIHQMETKNGKFYPEFCHGWDVDNGTFFDDRNDRCPCCACEVKGQYRYYINGIDIEVEENKPSRPKPAWSPIRYIDLSPSLFNRLKELKTVNNNVMVSDTEHGAIIQIKYNKDADPGSMYAASMDTKDVPITEEQKEYIVTQKYPDGSSKILRGKNGLPAQFEYIRCVNSRDDMVKSLRRNGYYGETEQTAAAEHSFDSKTLSREANVAKVNAEAPIEEMDLSQIFPGTIPNVADEDPTPPKAKAKVAAETKVIAEPHEECPTEFGKCASTIICLTECGVSKACRLATNTNGVEADAATTPAVTPTTKKKKEVAPVDDDDDTV